MKCLKHIIFFLFVFPICHADFAFGQQIDKWRVMPIRSEEEYKRGKIGGEGYQHLHGITRCLTKPEVIYLSQDCAQVWRSDNAGETWKKVLGESLYVKRGQSIKVDPIDPNIVFAILENHSNPSVQLAEKLVGLYRSDNGGNSWRLVLHAPTMIHRMYQHNISYDYSTATSLGARRWYAAFPNEALYISEDYGETWNSVSSLEHQNPVYAIHSHPSDGKTIFVASNNGLFSSSSNGANLQKIGNLPPGYVSSIAVSWQYPAIIFVTLKGRGLYSSQDGGETFSLLKKFDAHNIFINPGYPDILYLVGISSNIITSHDRGKSWSTKTDVVPAPGLNRFWKSKISGALAGVVPNPNNPDEAVAYAHAALWKTTDGGKTFHDQSTLFTGYAWSWWNDAAAFDAFNPNRFCFFCCDISMVITENGSDYFEKKSLPSNWLREKIINWTGMYSGDIQPIPGSEIIVASVGQYFRTKLARRTSAAGDWKIVDNNYENNLFIAFHPGDANFVYAGNKRSFNVGETFQPIQYLVERNAEILGLCLKHPDVIYAMSNPRKTIYRSNDRGDNWRVYANVGWYLCRLDSKPTFAVDPINPDKIYSLDRNGDLAVFDGHHWNSLAVLPRAGGTNWGNFVRSVAIDPQHPNIIYAGTYFAGLPHMWRSMDSGATWTDISANCPRLGAAAMAVHPLTGDLLQGTVYGTWVYPPPYESPNSLYAKCIQYD